MIETDRFLIGHIPKTGGHALAVICDKIKYKFSNFKIPFEINAERARMNIKGTIHTYFHEVNITNKILFSTLRRLPYWIYSMMWHQGIHTKLNHKGGVYKYKKRDVYTDEFQAKAPNLPLADFSCHTIYPDFILQPFLEGYEDQINWFRMEHLVPDLISNLKTHLNINLNKLEIKKLLKSSKEKNSYNTAKNVLRYFSQENINTLYRNNTVWAKIEKQVYGDTLCK